MDVNKLLKKLHIEDSGTYENHFYIINIPDSNAYAKMYSKLEQYAVNAEYPVFSTNTNNSTTKATNYFESEEEGQAYDLFLIADFDEDKYCLKIKEK